MSSGDPPAAIRLSAGEKGADALPAGYAERAYAGVLGKLIGVYLGRPIEGWTYERILREIGEIDGYVSDRIPGKPPLVVTDDDISGTFTFLRALPDYGFSPDLTAAQIGWTWLNYVIEERSTFWWGGLGNSTEHTAYLRLKQGIRAPESGSAALNGRIVAEQIGAQIFIDGWAMVSPGDPERAAGLARKAAGVSHDGEAVYAAQVLAAMQALAFVETDIDRLIDTGVSFIPPDSTVRRLIADVREWHAAEPEWHMGRAKLAAVYNYENYRGACHVVPNHALIILGLLYGEGDFSRSMRIVNTAGWDTDCNAGNLGCLLGIRGGLAAFEGAYNWRGPLADRLYLPSADGGRAITDAVIETRHIVRAGRALKGLPPEDPPGALRFNFEFPGSVQGFRPGELTTQIENVPGRGRDGGQALAIRFQGTGSVSTPTFILPSELLRDGYPLVASPTLYSGQRLTSVLVAESPASIWHFIRVYNRDGDLDTLRGPRAELNAGAAEAVTWRIPDTSGQPIAEIGIECRGSSGVVYLESLTWQGPPDVTLKRPAEALAPFGGKAPWRQAWVDAVDLWDARAAEPFRLAQNESRGMLIQGTREWADYTVQADITPWLAGAAGIAARVQGLERYYALLLVRGNKLRLLKALDGELVLAECDFRWEAGETCSLEIAVRGNRIRTRAGGERQFDLVDENHPLNGGGVAFIIERGTMASQAIHVCPFDDDQR